MNRKVSLATVAGSAFLFAVVSSQSLAGEIEAIFADVSAVHDGQGQSRILFRPTPIPFDEYTVIESATLRVPYAGNAEGRRLPLRICVVTGDWSRGGSWDTAYDPRLFATASIDLTSGTGVAVFDVTALLKEILEDGTPADGFVLTGGVKGSAGIATSDAARFASLEGGQLDIKTTVFPSGRPPRSHGEEDRSGGDE